MNRDSAHTSYWEISEVVFGIPLLASIILQWLVPLSLPEGIPTVVLIPLGIALVIAGISFILLARREFARTSQSMEPGHPISHVIRTGVFSVSRNPLYLGIVMTLSGGAFVFNALWILIFLVPSIILCHYILIASEERYLERKFGKEYLEYTASVRRWLGRR